MKCITIPAITAKAITIDKVIEPIITPIINPNIPKIIDATGMAIPIRNNVNAIRKVKNNPKPLLNGVLVMSCQITAIILAGDALLNASAFNVPE